MSTAEREHDLMTEYDDQRILAKIEAWEPPTGQMGLDEQNGMVVRVYDHGPPGDRYQKAELLLDSAVKHGRDGIFGSSQEASGYADRVEAGMVQAQRAREEITHERREALPARQADRWKLRDGHKLDAKASTAKAKEAQEEAETLSQEASSPSVQFHCPLRGAGYRILVAPSLTDGNLEAEEGRVLADTIRPPGARPKRSKPATSHSLKGESSIDKALDATQEARALPTEVPDADGVPLKVGSKAEHQDDGHGKAWNCEVTAILRRDSDDLWIVQVQHSVTGIPSEVASCELVRMDQDDWPV